jgi:ribosomal protein S18 acetylase RimI-like enzyme
MATMSSPNLPANVVLRDAVAADAQGIWRVHSRAIRASAASHYTEDELDAWVERVQPATYLGLLGSRRLVVAERTDGGEPRIVGFAELLPEEAVIEAIYVDPDWERRGIGTALARVLEDDVVARGFPWLVSDASLNAVPFYQALGFRQVALDHHELAPGVHIACVVMEKHLAGPQGARAPG